MNLTWIDVLLLFGFLAAAGAVAATCVIGFVVWFAGVERREGP